MKNTNWSSPKTNIIAALNDLRIALASGRNAKLVRAYNEECDHPILIKNENKDFRNYQFSIGYASTANKIMNDNNLSEFEKHLSLHYIRAFGTEDAMNKYYETGILSNDNFNGMGRNHLIKAVDYIKFLEDHKEYDRASMYKKQYMNVSNNDQTFFYDFFRLKRDCTKYNAKHFNHKLWVVQLLNDNEPKAKIPFMVHVLNILSYPLKYIPRLSKLHMPEYTIYTFRVGNVINGYSIGIQIPKKFSF